MNKQLPLFNWSLKKALDSETDSFVKARIRIIFTIILLSLLKTIIVIAAGSASGEWRQVFRASIALAAYVILCKVLLARPYRLKVLSQIMIIIGIVIVWTNIFAFANKVNLVTIQFIVMITLSSFYILGNRLGILYSFVSMLPVVVLLLTGGRTEFTLVNATQEFGSPGYEIIVILNFVTIVIAHYLFFDAFNANIIEKEKLNLQLRTSVAEANKLAASRSEFLSTMSHELRTPLNSVIGISELLLENKPAPHQKEDLKILQLSAHDLLALINNVLDFNKIDSEKIVLENRPVHIAGFMRNICSVLGVKAKNKQLAFVLNIDEQLENLNILCDATRLSQVIYNLIGNAIKFTSTGSVTVKLDVVEKTETAVDIMFCVQDTGIGIPAERHDTIFELFTQAESHINLKYGGTGLGLAIVKQLLKLFNSAIHLDSKQGIGSRFFFTIRFAATEEKAEADNRKDSTMADLSHLKILVAEDDEINRLVLSKQLDTLGVKPLIVENGVEAFDACMSWSFDAVFLDLHMPLAGGYETLKRIRSITDGSKAKVYTVAFTASVTEEQHILAAGFNDFLYKPTNLDDLRKKLENIARLKGVPLVA